MEEDDYPSVIKSVPLWKAIGYYAFLLLMCGVGAVAFYQISQEGTYINIGSLALGAIFFFICLRMLYIFPFKGQITFKDGELILKRFFGLLQFRHPVDSLTRYSEESRSRKSEQWWELKYYGTNGKVKIDSRQVRNYYDFTFLIDEIDEDKTSEDKRTMRIARLIGLVFMLFAAAGITDILLDMFGEYEPLKEENIVMIKGTLKEKLYIKKRKSHRSIAIGLNEYPEFTFGMGKTQVYAAFSSTMVNTLQPGDSLLVGIKPDAYEKKITKTRVLTFWDKFDGYNGIACYVIESNGKPYLTVSQYNAQVVQEKNSWKKYLALIICLVFLLIGIGLCFWLPWQAKHRGIKAPKIFNH